MNGLLTSTGRLKIFWILFSTKLALLRSAQHLPGDSPQVVWNSPSNQPFHLTLALLCSANSVPLNQHLVPEGPEVFPLEGGNRREGLAAFLTSSPPPIPEGILTHLSSFSSLCRPAADHHPGFSAS